MNSRYQDTRCVWCGSGRLDYGKADHSAADIGHGAIVCSDCGGRYDMVWGVPFFGGYEREDFLGLFEILRTARKSHTTPSPETIRKLNQLLADYHAAPDKAEFVRTHADPSARAPWFMHRYHEWLQMAGAIANKDLAGKKVLDVGAGTGHDAVRLSDLGAHVTALEYSPSLARRGRETCPQARWIGGFSHVLPFQDHSFDFVFANAAIHHMRDASASVREMLRVVRPGGCLITAGDPFRADATTEEVEFAVFNRHEAVLSGVNEGIPRFSDIYGPVDDNASRLDIALTCIIHQIDGPLQGTTPLGDEDSGFIWVPAFSENIDRLKLSHGGLGIIAQVREPLPLPAALQSRFVLPAGIFASWLKDETGSFHKLLPSIPRSMLDLAFPGTHQTKFELLNGWMAPEEPFDQRIGHGRARWFLTRPVEADAIRFDVRPVTPGPAHMAILVDGMPNVDVTFESDDWRPVEVDLRDVRPGAPCVVELQLDRGSTAEVTFDDSSFAVRQRTATRHSGGPKPLGLSANRKRPPAFSAEIAAETSTAREAAYTALWAQSRHADAASAATANSPDYKLYHINLAASYASLIGKSILVVGCNRGEDCQPFVELGASDVTGLDLFDEIGVNYTHDRVRYLKASVESIPLQSESFDLVFAYATLEHVHDINAAFAEMARVTALNGYIYSNAAPLWCTRQGPHWGSAYDSEPWPHLRYSVDELIDLGRRLSATGRDQDQYYYRADQIQYSLDPTPFNQRRANEYLNACSVIEGIKIIRNDIEMESQEGYDPAIVQGLLAKGYDVSDLFGLAHVFVAQKISRQK